MSHPEEDPNFRHDPFRNLAFEVEENQESNSRTQLTKICVFYTQVNLVSIAISF